MSTKEDFKNILQSKFNNWEHPVDESNWNEMRDQLNNARKINMRMKWAAVGSAILILAGIGSYVLMNRNAGKNGALDTRVENQGSTPAVKNQIVVASHVITSDNAKPSDIVAKENEKNGNNSTASTIANNGNSNSSHLNNATGSNSSVVASQNTLPTEMPVIPLTVNISTPASICSGNYATIYANIKGGSGEISYNWQPGNLAGSSITVSPSSSTIYTLSVTDNSGTITKTVSLVVNPTPQISFSSDIQKGCSPISVQFRNQSTITSGSITSWSWNFGNGDVSSVENPVEYFHNVGNYDVSLTIVSDKGCSSTMILPNMISIYSHPKASFTLSTQSPSTGTVVQFKDQSTDVYGINNWSWSFSDGSDNTSNLENPTHVYSDTGMFCTRLVVTNVNGCKDSASNCLAIAPIFNLYIPSGFTPNGDHRNDVFKPIGQYVKNFEMYIFNSQGAEVFHTNDMNQGWNGKMAGGLKVCPEGTYMYRIFVTDSQDKNHTYTGNVTIIK